MNTTFGIEIKGKITEIARRDRTEMYFINSLVEALPDETPVKPLNNTPQGIFTLGDIRKHIKRQEEIIEYNFKFFRPFL